MTILLVIHLNVTAKRQTKAHFFLLLCGPDSMFQFNGESKLIFFSVAHTNGVRQQGLFQALEPHPLLHIFVVVIVLSWVTDALHFLPY